jgi:hypothetical protein
VRLALALLALAAPLAAQGDFLTYSEIAQIREAQEPNLRLTLYSGFARQRVQSIKDLVAKQQAGRSALIHEALGAYSQILDAIDDLADQAAAHRTDVRKGLQAVASAERWMLSDLRRIRDSKPADLERYAFVLDQAIETTSDSLEAAQEDLDERGADVRYREGQEKKARDAEMAPADGSEKKSSDSKTEEKAEPKKPTLLRPGEKKSTPPQK